MQCFFKRSNNIIHHGNRVKEKNHMVISIDTEKHLIKFNMHSRVNNRTEMAEESKLEDRL